MKPTNTKSMRRSIQRSEEGEHEEHLLQMNHWLEEYQSQLEARESENSQLKLQIARMFETITSKDNSAAAQQTYIVDLEETVRILGDEIDALRSQLSSKESDARRMSSLLQHSAAVSGQEPSSEHEQLLAELLSLHEENAELRRLTSEQESMLNNARSECIDLKYRVRELERLLNDRGVSVEDVGIQAAPSDAVPAGKLSADSDDDQPASPIISRNLSRGTSRATPREWKDGGPDPQTRVLALFTAASIPRKKYFHVETPTSHSDDEGPRRSVGGAQWSPDSSRSHHSDSERVPAERVLPPPLPLVAGLSNSRSLLPNRDDLPTPPRVHRRAYAHK